MTIESGPLGNSGKIRAGPLGFFESRTPIEAPEQATSTQFSFPLKLLFCQFKDHSKVAAISVTNLTESASLIARSSS